MRKILVFLFCICHVLHVWSRPAITSGAKYHLVSNMFPQGCVTDGSSVGQQTPLYYLPSVTTASYTYWILTEESLGKYTIRNAATSHYVTYDGVRADSPVRRYVSLTAAPNGNYSLWTLEPYGGSFVIRNVGKSDHIWDVRSTSTSTPYVVGTYSNSSAGNSNQLFAIYDESGQRVKEQVEVDDPLSVALAGLRIGQHGLSYVNDLGYYLLTVPQESFGGDHSAVVHYELTEGWGSLTINGNEVPDGSTFDFGRISNGRKYTLRIVHSDGTVLEKQFSFTSLPVVHLFGSFGYDYAEGSVMVQEPDADTADMMDIKAKWRGGITNNSDKHKRNYHVKFLDADGQKMDKKFFGLREDNSWILEACQVDMSRMRNRILTDLWNDFSVKPYYYDQEPKARTGTRGRFVELVLNGQYQGIYCMTEAMDRKQLKLRKYDEAARVVHGQLWKSKDWSYAVFMGHYSNNNTYPRTAPANYNNRSESWDNYYVKYPDFDDVNPTDWQTLYDAVKFVCTSTDADFRSHVAEYFDLPLVIDYYILMETILSTDNHGKNLYFAVYDKQTDKRVTLGVWDMDATTGQRWSDAYYHWSGMRPEQDYSSYIVQNEHGDYNLFRRLRLTNADNFNMQVRLRYRDLRNGHLQTDAILDRFRRQREEFGVSGADLREYNRWSGDTDIDRKTLNFDTELSYLEDWITRRMNYLDKTRFDIASLPESSGVEFPTMEDRPVQPGVYNLRGQLISKDTREQILRSLPHGIYIINGLKVVL